MLIVALMGLMATSCYDFNREQREKDAESNGRATLLEAESSKKAKIEEAKADLESAKLNAETKVTDAEADAKASIIRAKAKAESMKIVSESITENYIRYVMVDGMYNHGNTIYVPTEAGVPIIQRK